MQLLNPLWLWGLLGLAVPVAIHLLSRKEGKVVKVGSIRHLTDSTTRRFKSIKLNEILLLSLRCFLLALIVALLSGLMMESSQTLPKWVLLERGVEANGEVARIADSLTSDGFEVRYLEHDFPLPDDTLEATPAPNYWYLAEELSRAEVLEAVVFSKAGLTGFKGKRSPKPPTVRWFDVPFSTDDFSAVSVPEGDSVWEITAESSENLVAFLASKSKASGQATSSARLATVRIAYDDQHAYDEKVLTAAFTVLNDLPGMALAIESTKAESFTPGLETITFWLAAGEAPSVSGKLVLLKETDANELLVRSGSMQWNLTRRLNKKTALDDHLVLQLASLLKTELPALAKYDQRVMPESWRWSKTEANETIEAGSTTAFADINDWLLALFVITLITERIVAWRRGQ